MALRKAEPHLGAAHEAGAYAEHDGKLAPEEVRVERLWASGFREPALIAAGSSPARTLRALGMKLPDTMTAESIAEARGRGHKCGTMLCGSWFAASSNSLVLVLA